jgi:hypothetical protein
MLDHFLLVRVTGNPILPEPCFGGVTRQHPIPERPGKDQVFEAIAFKISHNEHYPPGGRAFTGIKTGIQKIYRPRTIFFLEKSAVLKAIYL